MLGNFLRECGVTERLSKAAQNEIINAVTIFLGTPVGITMTGSRFLTEETLMILGLGVVAFGVATASGVLMAKLLSERLVVPSSLRAGLETIFEIAPDLEVDVPKMWDAIGRVIGKTILIISSLRALN